MALPPLELGAVKPTVAWVFPATAVPMVGALGTTALTVKLRGTCGAAKNAALPAWSALMVQVPAVTKVNTPPAVMVHTDVVADVNVGVKVDVAVAVNIGLVPKFCAAGFAKVIVCGAIGVTLLDAAEAMPEPTALRAVTAHVTAVPLVKPVTVIGDAVAVAVCAPQVAV
jgi:hypothetical protein